MTFMRTSSEHPSSIPRPVLIGAVLALGAAVIFAGLGRMNSIDEPTPAVFAPVESRDFRFEDQADGSVLVIDAADEAVVATLEPGAGGFERSVLRGLVRERRLSNVGGQSAFRLHRMANGGLMLGDPATGRQVHLAAFGPSNVAAFERLMTAGNDKR